MPQAILGKVLTLIFGDLLRARHSAPPASRLQSRLIASPRPPLQWTEVAGHRCADAHQLPVGCHGPRPLGHSRATHNV